MSELNQLTVAGTGEASSHEPDLFDARFRATVRYADPAAWITANAVHFALAGAEDLLAEGRHEIGMIAISDQGLAQSMAKVQAEGRQDFPLRCITRHRGRGRWWESLALPSDCAVQR